MRRMTHLLSVSVLLVGLGLVRLGDPPDGERDERSERQYEDDYHSPLGHDADRLPHLCPVEGLDVSVGILVAVVEAVRPSVRVSDHEEDDGGDELGEPDDEQRAEVVPPHLLAGLLVRGLRVDFIARFCL